MSSNLSYEYERDDYYCYPGSAVLKNKLNLLSEIHSFREGNGRVVLRRPKYIT